MACLWYDDSGLLCHGSLQLSTTSPTLKRAAVVVAPRLKEPQPQQWALLDKVMPQHQRPALAGEPTATAHRPLPCPLTKLLSQAAAISGTFI